MRNRESCWIGSTGYFGWSSQVSVKFWTFRNLINYFFSLPYTEACLRESLRFETLVPSSVVHTAMVDTQLDGYDIPKGSFVYPGLHTLHFDKELWVDPENFRPERFIEDGKLSLKKDKSLPFGGGRRLCAGETFARNTMFLCTTALIQNFNFKLDPNVSLAATKSTKCGLVRVPDNFWLKFETKWIWRKTSQLSVWLIFWNNHFKLFHSSYKIFMWKVVKWIVTRQIIFDIDSIITNY